MDFRCRAYLVFILRTLFFVCLGFLQSGDAYEWSALKQAHAAHWRMANWTNNNQYLVPGAWYYNSSKQS